MMENSSKQLSENKSGLRTVRLACTAELNKQKYVSNAKKNSQEKQKMNEDIDRDKSTNRVLKWTDKINLNFSHHESRFLPKVKEIKHTQHELFVEALKVEKEGRIAVEQI